MHRAEVVAHGFGVFWEDEIYQDGQALNNNGVL